MTATAAATPTTRPIAAPDDLKDGSPDPSLNRQRLHPPSVRDAEVFHAIVAEGVSTREVAAGFEISQTRVRQIVQRLFRWLAAVLPAEAAELPPNVALLLAQHTAAERMDTLYEHAMHCWRQRTETKYASLMLRLAVARAKLPVVGSIRGLIAERIDLPPAAGGPMVDPPAEDCSPSPADPPSNPSNPNRDAARSTSTNACSDTTCNPSPPKQDAAASTSLGKTEPLLTPRREPASTPTFSLPDEDIQAILRRTSRRAQRLRRAK